MTPSLTQQQIETALRAFLITVLPQGVEIIQGQENRVPEPSSDNFVIMWAVNRKRLGYTVLNWDRSPDGSPTTLGNTEPVRIDEQLDFHGADSTDNAQVFAVTFRSPFACDFFRPYGFQPNYCSDGAQAPFINGAQQFEDRWTLVATFDANITVSTPQEFANAVSIDLIEVDERYPPI